MSISLSKGGNVSLTKEDPNLKRILVGLGWDARATDGADFDLDASAFLLTNQGKVRGDSDFIFYNNLKSSDGAIIHQGDDEVVEVTLDRVASDIDKVAFSVTIHEAENRHQNFGMVGGAFIRVVNAETQREIVRFDLSEDMSTETAMVFGEVYRNNGEWKFRAVGQGFNGGLGPLAKSYGVSVG